MSSYKRRQTLKEIKETIEMSIPTNQTKSNKQGSFSDIDFTKLATKSVKQLHSQSMNFNVGGSCFGDSRKSSCARQAFAIAVDQNSDQANTRSTPYRSMSRVKNLLNHTPYQQEHGSARFIDATPPSTQRSVRSIRKAGYITIDESKPSSVTTACTYAPNEMSATRSTTSSKYAGSGTKRLKSDKLKKSDPKKQQTGSKGGLVGSKRQAQMKIDQMEYFTRLHSSVAKHLVSQLKLRDKKTGIVYDFPLYREGNLAGFDSGVITDFNMAKLEVEYDYDTDSEQLQNSNKMLMRELIQAIDFFVTDNPLKLVDNLRL